MNLIDEIISKIKKSRNAVELIINPNPTDEILNLIGITENSTLGTLLKYTNGILVKNKILRLFGSGSSDWTDSIKDWNNFPNKIVFDDIPSGCLLIGYDLYGGFFAINGGFFGKDLRNVFYFAPDSMQWENLNIGHSQFIEWCINGEVGKFYASFANDDLEDLVNKTKMGQCISFYPFLWSNEGKDISRTTKRVVPLREIWGYNMETSEKLNV